MPVQATPAQVPAAIFRAYDIRGIVDDTLTAETVYQIGQAFARKAQQQGIKTVLVGRDGRLSGPILAQALMQGLMASGCDVMDLGALPTPALYFATHVLGCTTGMMLTGSHNPPHYNGVKMVLAGKTLAQAQIQDLYQCIRQQDFIFGSGTLLEKNILPQYMAYLTQHIHLQRRLKIVIDCGNGIPACIAPELFNQLGCAVVPLYCEVNGNFPHHEPDPSRPENLQMLIQTVKAHQADVGLAFDGDGDRIAVVTNTGKIIWPDRLMMLFAREILRAKPQSKIIFDVKCTKDLAKVIEQYGGMPIMWKTGHSFMKAKIMAENAALAGEMSGHIFFKDRYFGFDDGLYAVCRLLEISAREPRDIDSIFRDFPESVNTPEIKIPIAENVKFKFMAQFIRQANFPAGELNTIDGLRVDFAKGWGLLRPSNTSPYLICRFEADSQQTLQHIQQLFKTQLLQQDPELELAF